MARIVHSGKACSTNPLKHSAPLGGALAFMGLDGCMPLLHGSQGCTAFALVLMVRHYRESIPLQTTAMNEVTTVLGGLDNLEQALVNIRERAHPKVIGILTTGLTETRGEDFPGDLRIIRERRPELADTALVLASTPDFSGGLQEGWGKAVTAMIHQLVEAPALGRDPEQVNVLAPSHFTPGDVEEVKDIVEAFGLRPVMLPDLSLSLDGHVPERWVGATLGGTSLEDIRGMGRSILTLTVGEHMRWAAEALKRKTGVPYRLFDGLTGLRASDALISALAEASGRPVPERLRRQRSRLVDAMLDGHFAFSGRRVAVAAEPDHLLALGSWLAEMGVGMTAAITTVHLPMLARVPADEVVVGDLGDLEARAGGCDLLLTHAHGRQASERLGIPLFRVGFPIFDRLGAAHQVGVGYRGTCRLIFEIANILTERSETHAAPAAR
ncbi:MAG: nitrogenase iron-molybdenum cofactor biosynthesis protein NifN [Alphaproteobacteria bacterium]|nr:nitrogenase iron-molybdenum cofactor biosynthesis protein NifN [Alphaproteobacteria bacterium]